MEVKKLIRESLNIPVIDLHEPVIPPCCTYFLQSERAELYGDGKDREEAGEHVIDVWCKDRKETIEKSNQLKDRILMHPYCVMSGIEYTYDTNGRIWRGTIQFSCIKEE